MPAVSLQAPTLAADEHCRSPLPSLLQTPLGLAIIEIQGSLNLPASVTEPSADDQQPASTQIGRLVFPLLETAGDAAGSKEGAWMKKAYLYVGQNQRLVGEVRRLKRALGVVRRQDAPEHDARQDSLQIVDVVKWKVFFGGRPEFV